jgi:hypothetical protein
VDARPVHPNAPRRTQLALAFAGIVLAGMLGGTIGWGIVDTTCTEKATVAQQLLEDVPGYHAEQQSCDLALIGGALAGTVITAVGAAVVAVLVLRAQSEWRAHPPGPRRATAPVRPARSGGSPPHM